MPEKFGIHPCSEHDWVESRVKGKRICRRCGRVEPVEEKPADEKAFDMMYERFHGKA